MFPRAFDPARVLGQFLPLGNFGYRIKRKQTIGKNNYRIIYTVSARVCSSARARAAISPRLFVPYPKGRPMSVVNSDERLKITVPASCRAWIWARGAVSVANN